jgi:hypothetical protein
MAVRFSASRAGRPLFAHMKIPATDFCYRLSRPHGDSVARIRSTEKYSDLIGNRTDNLLVCSIVPQPSTLPRAPSKVRKKVINAWQLYVEADQLHLIENKFCHGET